MSKAPYTSYNPYFLVPFGIWVISGGVLLSVFDKELLFTAANTNHTPFADGLMYYTTLLGEGGFITVLLLVLLGISRFRNWWYFTAAVGTGVLPSLVTQYIKRTVDAPRPLKFFNEAEWIHTLPQWPRLMEHSFPSGHTCGAFSLFCFLSLLLSERYRYWGILFFVFAAMVGYSRMYVAAHFFEDVYAGSILGVSFTLLVTAIMRRYEHLFFKRS